MLDLLEIASDGLKLDHSDWTLVKFGDIAVQQKQIVDRENTELARYVKGEHMGSEDIHLRKWGELKDEYLGPAFIRKFEEGDILYGSRRTYLRKVVVAPFEGITSNTTFVIKANEELIDKRLLPYVMLSEGFSQHSIRNSKGSVNPYINWKDIAGYDFLLPPKHLQKDIVDLLCSIDALIENRTMVSKRLNYALALYFDKEMSADHKNRTVLKSSIKKIVAGKSPQGYPQPARSSEYGVLKVSAIGDGEYVEAENKEIVDQAKFDSKYEVNKGYLLVTRANANLSGIGRACIVNETRSGLMLSDKTLRLIPDDKVINDRFLFQQLRTKEYRSYIESAAGGTDAKNISQKLLLEAPIWLPELPVQEQIVVTLSNFDSAIEASRNEIISVKALYLSTINQVF
ncbi:MAG: restriction endonuclease subunit S [Candidatus Sedimenticola sp. (ex Thyasira tokunagai)]